MLDGQISKVGSVSTLALLAAMPAAAQDFYAGVGISTTETDAPVLDTDDVEQFDLFAGARWSQGNFFYGGELDVSTSDDLNTTRLKGLAGLRYGPADVFVSVGVARFDGDIGFFELEDSGTSASIGLDYTITDSIKGRLEYQYDEVDVTLDGYDPASHSSIRAAVIFQF